MQEKRPSHPPHTIHTPPQPPPPTDKERSLFTCSPHPSTTTYTKTGEARLQDGLPGRPAAHPPLPAHGRLHRRQRRGGPPERARARDHAAPRVSGVGRGWLPPAERTFVRWIGGSHKSSLSTPALPLHNLATPEWIKTTTRQGTVVQGDLYVSAMPVDLVKKVIPKR